MFAQLIHDYEQALQQIPALVASGLLLEPECHPVDYPLFHSHSVRVDVLRCDRLHPVISGNKWFKLKYNLILARQQQANKLVSYGGAWSNHLHALAYCANLLGIDAVGRIRGEEWQTRDNAMLADARNWGMTLEFLSRHAYRQETRLPHRVVNHDQYGIPEGGDNWAGVLGCMTLVPQRLASDYDLVVLALGTGCTFAGLRLSLPARIRLLGVSALKGDWPQREMRRRLSCWPAQGCGHYDILTDYHAGGFGRASPALLSFITDFGDNTELPLDPVYTGKAMWALCDLIQRRKITSGTRVLFIHSGGLQGVRGYQTLAG